METIGPEVTGSTEIDAPVEKVREALTTPPLIKKWCLRVDTESDWNVGSSIVHRGEYEGKPYVDAGEILTGPNDHGEEPAFRGSRGILSSKPGRWSLANSRNCSGAEPGNARALQRRALA